MNDAAPELVGRTLSGRFRITGFLGEGAMASVYRAEQEAEPKDVALKVMHPELLRDETFAKRFAREAKAAARIVHRNTVRILEHGADGEHLYLAMELLVGRDLFDTLAQSGRLPEARAAKIAVQVCSALEAAHAQRIVHRDLKPENVFIERDPDDPEADLVKVLDFGIAKTMERDREGEPPPSSDAPPSSALTRVGSIVGTPEYMAPEQGMGLAVDARTDVYACGVLLFHMITGRTPFVGKTPVEVLVQLHGTPPPAPSSLVSGIHPSLEKLILKALAKAPDDRPQSARELREALLALLPELGAASRRAPAPSSGQKVAGLPGVPSEVAISREREPASSRREGRADVEDPPATLRSRPDEGVDGASTAPEERGAEPEAKPSAITKEEKRAGNVARASAPVDDEPPISEPETSSARPLSIRPLSSPRFITPGAARPITTGKTPKPPSPASQISAQAHAKREAPKAGAPEKAMFAQPAKGGWVVPAWAFFAALAVVTAILWLMSRGARP